jgi:hypothetical protein
MEGLLVASERPAGNGTLFNPNAASGLFAAV